MTKTAELFENSLQTGGHAENVSTENVLKTKLLKNNGVTKTARFSNRVFLQNKSKMTVDCCVFLHFSGVMLTESAFRVKLPFSSSSKVV